MSNKDRRKAGVKAKQETMRRAKEEGGQSIERQTSGLDTVLQEKGQIAGEDSARETVQSALNKAAASGVDIDERILGLFDDFKRYRVIVVVLVVIAFGIMLASMGLYSYGYIDEDMQNNLLILAAIVAAVFVAIIVGRVRPIREDINAWNKINELALAQSKGAHGATEADVDKIFYQRSRNKRVPPTAEYKRVRRVWYALVVVATILMVTALLIARGSMNDVTVPVVILIVSFVILLIATILERSKMKPMREAYLEELDRKVKAADKKKRKGRKSR